MQLDWLKISIETDVLELLSNLIIKVTSREEAFEHAVTAVGFLAKPFGESEKIIYSKSGLCTPQTPENDTALCLERLPRLELKVTDSQ